MKHTVVPPAKNEPTLADAINADRERRGETVAQWAAREGVPFRTVSDWLVRPPVGHMARLLASRLLQS